MKSVQKYQIRLKKTGKVHPLFDTQFDGPNSVNECAKEYLKDRHNENFIVFGLTTANTVIGLLELTSGDLAAALVSPADILMFAINSNSASIVVAHNHPSGSLSASPADIKLTNQLHTLFNLVSRPLLDHIIVGDDDYYSFAEHGLL